mmetsp:Transcript_12395/g.24584  ORF Transcript_12395/g.24584 Transcript_12395/m.24584 type:complete len:666 (+) Transcript_12395:131-2128(+)
MMASATGDRIDSTLSAISDMVSSDEFVSALLTNAMSSSRGGSLDATPISEGLVREMGILYSSLVPLLPRKPDIEELFTGDGMDGEGLWAQVEMATEGLHRGIRKLGQGVALLDDVIDDVDEPALGDADEGGDSGMEDPDDDAADEDAPDEETLRIRERMERAMVEMDSSDSDSEADSEGEEQGDESSLPSPTSSGEDGDPMGNPMRDGFFDVNHMEDWADEEERLHYRPEKKSTKRKDSAGYNSSEEEDEDKRAERDDDEMDVLARLYDDDEGGDSEDEYNNLTAEDFFGKPDVKSMQRYKMSVGRNRNASVDEMEGSYDKRDVSAPSAGAPPRHPNPTKLEQQTRELEEEALAEKPWTMMGEINAGARPVDSLLSAAPEFEQSSKLAPDITVEHTESLEDMIKRRILAEDWDDVVPRELPTIDSRERGTAAEVSQEKSKLGLGELYERDYLKKAVGYDVEASEKETAESLAKAEMKALFAKLCSKLDALSNYHFAPRPVAEEAEVKRATAPAIAMEEVMPLTVSDAKGSAPEEVYAGKRGRDSVLKDNAELEQSERKRLRATKKQARRKERRQKQADEKLISRLKPGLGLNNPYEARKLREDLSKARSSGAVTEAKMDGNDDFNTSAKFFERLQKTVRDDIRGGAKEETSGKKSTSKKTNQLIL